MSSRAGAIYALLAYASWGLLPIYWKLLAQVPAHEILMHRVLWTALFALALAALVGRRSEIGAICATGAICSRWWRPRCCSPGTGSPSSGR